VSSTGTYNLSIDQGATYERTFVWKAGVCVGQGTVGAVPIPVDLTGYTAELQIRSYNMPTAPLLYDATPDIVLGGVNGTIQLTIDATDTVAMTWYSGFYDLKLTDSSGVVTRLLKGKVTISPAVST
jgi:hypothetical protein